MRLISANKWGATTEFWHFDFSVYLKHSTYGIMGPSQCLLTCPWAAAKAMTRLNQVGLHLLLNKQRKFRCISVDDCAQTEIQVCAFGADSGPGPRTRSQASNTQTPILVRAQSPVQMPAEVADFPLIFSKIHASYA